MKYQELIVSFIPEGFVVDQAVSVNKDFFFDQALLDHFRRDRYAALYNFGFDEKQDGFSPSLAFLHRLSVAFNEAQARDSDLEISRAAKPVDKEITQELLRVLPFANGIEFVNSSWIKALWDRLCGVFAGELAAFGGSVAEYLKSKRPALNPVGRVFFHLVENKDAAYPFAFLATYSTGTKEKISHLPLKNALLEYQSDQATLLALLATVSRTADKSQFVSELVESGELFSPLQLTAEEAYVFLRETPLYEECGIVCRIPDWWKRKSNVRVSLTVGDKTPAALGLDALLSFQPSIFLGDTAISKEEAEALLAQTNGLSFLKGKWVEVNREKLEAALAAFDQAAGMNGMSFAEAMRLQLNLNNTISQAAGEVSVEVTNGQWLEGIRDRLLNPAKIEELSTGKEFRAALRHYQQDGLNWLGLMQSLGLGALLADDMGLGKTVQILALLEVLRQKGSVKALLVIPASLIVNWQNEATKFAPGLRYRLIHAGCTEVEPTEADLFITTYGMAMRLEFLREIKWDLVILDEAQAIKNAGTKQTKAIKELPAAFRIAMTGTPIENRLGDLWSIFDFLNRGLLGSSKEFTAFTKSLQTDGSGYARLREIVSPFILRRLKTDKSVIADLPDKIEVKEYADLTKKQVLLYSSLVSDLQDALEKAEGIGRKGLVLASIMKFKQICNHPDQYLGQNSFDLTQSGKFQMLWEICTTIYEKRERVLVFTQFKEMTEPIAALLSELFQREGLVLHGGTPVKKRGELVARFNGEEYVPFMVLSLKAGGVGLNLTAANHVIHFDRWWNPAVENQATDRAFRIGQKKNVVVHKLITGGTIEEKIDSILEEKKTLADSIIASGGENWITEMNNEELMKLFALGVQK